MPEKDKVTELRVRQKAGPFDFGELYKFLWRWLSENGYDPIDEKDYTEKVTPTGKNVDIEWRAYRNVSDYFQYEMQIKWMILGMSD